MSLKKFLKVATAPARKVFEVMAPVSLAVGGMVAEMPPTVGFSAGKAVSSFLGKVVSPEQQDALTGALAGVMMQPAEGSVGAQEAGSAIKTFATNLGLGANASSIAGALAHAAASLKPEQAVVAMDQAANQLTFVDQLPGLESSTAAGANSFLGGVISKQEAKDVLNSTVAGIKSGITTGLMNTEAGQQMVKDGADAKLSEIMPILAMIGFGLFLASASGLLGAVTSPFKRR